jgi:hypothetical protein
MHGEIINSISYITCGPISTSHIDTEIVTSEFNVASFVSYNFPMAQWDTTLLTRL